MHRNHEREERLRDGLGCSHQGVGCPTANSPGPLWCCSSQECCRCHGAIAAGTKGADNQTEGLGHLQTCSIYKEKNKEPLSPVISPFIFPVPILLRKRKAGGKHGVCNYQPSGLAAEVQLLQDRDIPRSRDRQGPALAGAAPALPVAQLKLNSCCFIPGRFWLQGKWGKKCWAVTSSLPTSCRDVIFRWVLLQ